MIFIQPFVKLLISMWYPRLNETSRNFQGNLFQFTERFAIETLSNINIMVSTILLFQRQNEYEFIYETYIYPWNCNLAVVLHIYPALRNTSQHIIILICKKMARLGKQSYGATGHESSFPWLFYLKVIFNAPFPVVVLVIFGYIEHVIRTFFIYLKPAVWLENFDI